MDDMFGPIMVLAGVLILGGVFAFGLMQRKKQTAPPAKSGRDRDMDTINQIRDERR